MFLIFGYSLSLRISFSWKANYQPTFEVSVTQDTFISKHDAGFDENDLVARDKFRDNHLSDTQPVIDESEWLAQL